MKPSNKAGTGRATRRSEAPPTAPAGNGVASENVGADLQDIELQLLLEAIYRYHGHDFRNYAQAHVLRRILNRMSAFNLNTISELQSRVLHDRDALDRLLLDLSISVTEMFRDPPYYRALRQEVIPVLKTWPYLKIWHAGCATGEEVYSTAILLHEEGLYDRCQIYATDFNPVVLRKARDGIYAAQSVREYTANYQKAGGTASFSDYYTADYGSVILDQALKERIVFTEHNLVTDGVFGDMNLVVCRNVLIYFNRILQNRVIGLFHESLCPGGFLCLGTKETLRFSQYSERFLIVSEKEKIYRKPLGAS